MHAVGRALHATFQDICHAKLLRYFAQTFRRTLIAHSGRARDHFQIGDLGQPHQDFLLNSVGEYAFSGLPLKFSNGSTAIDLPGTSTNPLRLLVAVCCPRKNKLTEIAPATMTIQIHARPRDCADRTSISGDSVRLIPSGVSSNAQARLNATGNPIPSSNTTRRTAQLGISKNGKTCVATCINSQATTA